MILEALSVGRAVYVTDGTITRRVIQAEEEGQEMILTYDLSHIADGLRRRVWISDENFRTLGGWIIEDIPEGLYIAPCWWVRIVTDEPQILGEDGRINTNG